MRKPGLGESSLGAMAGAVVGAIGGLFAVGLAQAIIRGHLALLFQTPILGLICWLISGASGWLLGGQIGPRCGEWFGSERAEIAGGIAGGILPVLLIALWGWYMATH